MNAWPAYKYTSDKCLTLFSYGENCLADTQMPKGIRGISCSISLSIIFLKKLSIIKNVCFEELWLFSNDPNARNCFIRLFSLFFSFLFEEYFPVVGSVSLELFQGWKIELMRASHAKCIYSTFHNFHSATENGRERKRDRQLFKN